jgi:hypothetical protein
VYRCVGEDIEGGRDKEEGVGDRERKKMGGVK